MSFKYNSILSNRLIEINSGENFFFSHNMQKKSLNIKIEQSNISNSIPKCEFTPKNAKEVSSPKKREVTLLKKTLEKEFTTFLEERKNIPTNPNKLKIYHQRKISMAKSNMLSKNKNSFNEYCIEFKKSKFVDQLEEMNLDSEEKRIPDENESPSSLLEGDLIHSPQKSIRPNLIQPLITFCTPKANKDLFLAVRPKRSQTGGFPKISIKK